MPLRGDEAFSALYWVDIPLSQSLGQIAPLDPHPPLTYVLFRLWGLAIGGIDSVFSLRYLPALGNILGVAAVFALAWRLTGRRNLGFLAALMYALHPFEIWHSQDFRNYALWAGLSVTALWLGLRVFECGKQADWWGYALFAAWAALTFYSELTLLLSLGIIAIATRNSDRSFLQRFLLTQAAIAGLCAD